MEQKKIKSTNFFQDGIQKFGNTKKSEERYKTKDIFFFFTFYIFIQIVWNIIRTIIYPNWIKTVDDFFLNQITDDKIKLLIFYYFDIVFINVFCPMIAIIWLLKKNSKHFMRNKFWILLYFFPGRFIIAQILSYANMNNNSFQLVTSVIIPLIVLAIYFIKNYDFVKQVKLFFNSNSLIFFITVSIIGVISFILLLSILGGITLGIGGGNPVNESNIQNFLKNPYSITVVFFTVVIIAPFIEEFVFRESLAEVACNKWWAWPISTIFFAFAHISRSGDWINILVYVPLGLVNGFFYYKLRNITFPILLHFGNNLIAFIGYFI